MIYPNKPLYLLSLLGYIYYLTYYTLTTKDNIFLSLYSKYTISNNRYSTDNFTQHEGSCKGGDNYKKIYNKCRQAGRIYMKIVCNQCKRKVVEDIQAPRLSAHP